MPIFEIETPDGRTLDIEAGDEASAIAGAQQWYAANPTPDPKAVLDAEVAAGKHDGSGLFGSFGAGAQRVSDMLTDPLGVQDELVGAGGFARKLVTSGGDIGEAGAEYTRMAEIERAKRRRARDVSGVPGMVGEVITGIGTTGIGKAPAAAMGAWETLKQAMKAGGVYGGVTGATNAEGGAGERLKGAVQGGLIGAGVGGTISNVVVPVASRVYGAGKSAVNYARAAGQAAREPEQAAIAAIGEQAADSGLDFARVRAAIQPPASPALTARGFSDDDLTDIISRQLAGEPAAVVGSSYGIGEGTARAYLKKYRDNNPTPMNLADLAVLQQGYQGAMPLLRRARANYSIAPDANLAQSVENRQLAAPGRMADIIEQSGKPAGGGPQRKLDDELRYLAGAGKTEERQAYNVVRQQAQPIDIKGPIREARIAAQGRQGEIAATLNKATDLFFEPELRQALQSPMTRYRLQTTRAKIREAVDAGDIDKAAKLQLRLGAMREQDDFTRPLRNTKVGKPIEDMRRFLDARHELDQMIARSHQDGKPTPLTDVLTQFRKEVNGAARSNNKYLVEADRRFYDNRTAEELIKQGEGLAKGLNPRSREAMREFEDLTPTQQEIFRVAFERHLKDNALNVGDGNNAARQFGTPAFREMVAAFYPKSAGADVAKRGEALIAKLRGEAVAGNTGTFITNRQNSPTALILEDIGEQKQNAKAAADLATGRFGRLIENLSDRLAKQIGQQASAAQLRIVLESDPAKLLRMLPALEAASKNAAARKKLVSDIREMRAFTRPQVAAVAAETATRNRDRPRQTGPRR